MKSATKNRFGEFLLVAILLFVFEGAVRFFAFKGLVPIRLHSTGGIDESFLGDLNPHFGTWHYPNRTIRHQSPCFDVEYSSNSHGARDVERDLETDASRRVVVLGDSFVEGFGVTFDDRMTTVAEKLSNIEFLNFGVSGSFSSTQEWLLYRELASQFEHTDVVILLLPHNDFRDNNPERFPKRRYRPYLRKTSTSNFELYYPVAFAAREQPEPMGWLTRARRTLYNHVYLLNFFRQLGDIFEHALWSSPDPIPTETEKEVLLHGYEEIITLAGNRSVTIVIAPRLNDLIRSPAPGYGFQLVDELRQFASKYPNVRVVDLIPEFERSSKELDLPFSDYYYSCDGHWTPLGNRVAGEALARFVKASSEGRSKAP